MCVPLDGTIPPLWRVGIEFPRLATLSESSLPILVGRAFHRVVKSDGPCKDRPPWPISLFKGFSRRRDPGAARQGLRGLVPAANWDGFEGWDRKLGDWRTELRLRWWIFCPNPKPSILGRDPPPHKPVNGPIMPAIDGLLGWPVVFDPCPFPSPTPLSSTSPRRCAHACPPPFVPGPFASRQGGLSPEQFVGNTHDCPVTHSFYCIATVNN